MKKLRDKKDPESQRRNQLADEQRAEIEVEFKDATTKIEIEHGSAFIIHDHFIITNKHVTEDAVEDKTIKKICISNATIGELPCKVADYDAGKDLALLHCQGLDLKQNGICPLRLSKQSLLPGMQIFCFGYPMSHTGKNSSFYEWSCFWLQGKGFRPNNGSTKLFTQSWKFWWSSIVVGQRGIESGWCCNTEVLQRNSNIEGDRSN